MKALPILLFCLLCGKNPLFSQGFQPINTYHREKDYPGDKIRETSGLDAVALIRQIAGDFELGREKWIAILVNGKFEARVHGNADFDLEKTANRLNDKIVPGAIERVEARYDLNYTDPWNALPYTGTINFIIPALSSPNMDPTAAEEQNPEPWENPMTKRLLAAQEPDTRFKKLESNSSTRFGIFAGRQFRGPNSIFVGVPVEVPLTRRLSLAASIMWHWRDQELVEVDSTGFRRYSSNVERAMEASLLAKAYLNTAYPRVYGMAGPYLERDRLKRSYYDDPEPAGFEKVHTAIGLNFGVGILVHAGLYVDIGGSAILTRHDKLLPFQDLRGLSISVGWLFGKR